MAVAPAIAVALRGLACLSPIPPGWQSPGPILLLWGGVARDCLVDQSPASETERQALGGSGSFPAAGWREDVRRISRPTSARTTTGCRPTTCKTIRRSPSHTALRRTNMGLALLANFGRT